jgi:hypothetical protein
VIKDRIFLFVPVIDRDKQKLFSVCSVPLW